MPNLLSLIPGANWKHPNPRLQTAWNFARNGILIFPLLPSIGVFPIFIALVLTWIKATPEILSHRVNWCLAIWSGWSIMVSLLAIDPGEALLGLANFIPYFCLFAAYSVLIQTLAQLRQLAWICLLSAIPVIILGYGELWLGWGGDLAVGNTPIHVWDMTPGGTPQGRMASVFGYANGLAEYLQMVFILALGLWIDTWEDESTRRQLSLIQIWITPKLIYLSGHLILCGIALIATSSRSAWGGTIAATLIFAVYQSWYWLLGLVAAAMAIVFSSAYAPDPVKTPLRSIVPRYFWARITDEMYPDRPDAMTRIAQWKFAWKLTQDRPITGWGLQSFGKLYQAHSQLWLGHPHNIILMLSANLGLPAMIGLVSIVGWIVAQATILFLNFPIDWRHSRTIFFTFMIGFGGFIMFNMTDVTAPDLRLNTFAWLLLASLCGLFYQSQPSANQSSTSVSSAAFFKK